MGINCKIMKNFPDVFQIFVVVIYGDSRQEHINFGTV